MKVVVLTEIKSSACMGEVDEVNTKVFTKMPPVSDIINHFTISSEYISHLELKESDETVYGSFLYDNNCDYFFCFSVKEVEEF